MKKRISSAAVLLLVITTLFAQSVQAASSKAYVKLYKALLEQGGRTTTTSYGSYQTPFTSFLLLDINRDGTPELVTKSSRPETAFCTVMIYTVRKRKLYYCGEYSTKTQANLLYNRKAKTVYDSWWTNGVGGSGSVTYAVNAKKHKIVVKRWAWTGADGYGSSKMVYRIGAKQTSTTKSKFNKYVKKYFAKKRFKTYKYVLNTASNRASKIR